MDHYYEGQHGTVCDFDLEGPTHLLAEYAVYSTDQLIEAFIAGREPWEKDLLTGQ